MTATDVPLQVRHGRAVLNAVRFLADSADAGDRPDQTTLGGTVTLTPSPRLLRWPTTSPPRVAHLAVLECPVIDGDLYPPGTTPDDLPADQGVSLVASAQPDAEPDHLQWWATFRLTTDGQPVDPQPAPLAFEVPDDGVVDLALVVPVRPAPGVVHVVSSADRLAAELAAGQARGSATAAGAAATSATQSAKSADASAAAAAGSATTASGAAASAQAAGLAATGAAAVVAQDAAAAREAATTATGAASAATGATTRAEQAAGSADASATTAGHAATSATSAATIAGDAAAAATSSADQAAAAAHQATDAAASVSGFRIFLVPHTKWPPAPDPNPLHWYVRVWEEP